jgi:hypothetical protein
MLVSYTWGNGRVVVIMVVVVRSLGWFAWLLLLEALAGFARL